MKARLFCEHCDKFYEVNIEEIRIIQNIESDNMSFAHNTYFYKDGCFFDTLKNCKKELQKSS